VSSFLPSPSSPLSNALESDDQAFFSSSLFSLYVSIPFHRCQSLEGLKILNYHPSKVRASGKVLEWQKSHGIRDAPELPKPLAPSQMSTPTTEVAKDETELDKG
jgi:hypothetical protein